ncbi:MAG TPA: alpha/beta fold hydrolase [Gaiellaceae bacterium]
MARLLALLAIVAAAGCGGSSFSGLKLASVCGAGTAASPRWLETGDGLRLYAATEGQGDTTVVLAHESGAQGLCGWLPTMRFLAANGIRALAFDFRGVAPSAIPPARTQFDWWRDLQAAVDAAHAKRVVLMGASMGGAIAVADAYRIRGIDAVVSLSGELSLPASHVDALAGRERLRAPLLVVASTRDGYLLPVDARRLKPTRLLVFPGYRHGWEIVDELPRARQLVLDWIRRPRR